MNLAPLLSSTAFIQVHAGASLLAIILGAVQLIRSKGTPGHRMLGRIWIGTMVVVALSSFWIKEIMPGSAFFGFSPIHILSVVSMVTITGSLLALRRGNIEAHARSMQSLYALGLITAGAFTFLPGRILYRVFFGQ